MINGVILQKLQALDQTLTELRSLGQVEAAQLSQDWRTRRAIERDLQLLAEIVIDICQCLLSLTGHPPAATGADAIRQCVQLGVLSSYDTYHEIPVLWKLTLHYELDNIFMLAEIVNRRLINFDRFRTEVLTYAQR